MQYRTSKLLPLAGVLIMVFMTPLLCRGNGYFLHLITIIAINIILATSLRLVLLTGHLSIGHAAFMAIGAYTSAILATKLGFPFVINLLAGGIFAAAVAVLLGIPILKLSGIYFALVTFAFGSLTRLVIIYWDTFTGGPAGIRGIPHPSFFGMEIATRFGLSYLGLVLAGACVLVLYFIERSRVGKVFKAISQAPDLAESVGISVAGYDILAFAIASFFAGIAGSFYGHYTTFISADRFEIMLSSYILVYNIVGGEANIFGPVLGAVFMTLLNEPFRGYTQYEMIFFSISLMIFILLLPEGLISVPGKIAGYVTRLSNSASGLFNRK